LHILCDIILVGARHFRELLAGPERISSNILADRLAAHRYRRGSRTVTTQHVREVPAIIDDPATLARVKQAVDGLDTKVSTQYAIEQGVTPPTDEFGWMLCQRFEADGSEGPLVWVHVIETEDTNHAT
jgi:hypothetical protein